MLIDLIVGTVIMFGFLASPFIVVAAIFGGYLFAVRMVDSLRQPEASSQQHQPDSVLAHT